MLKDNTNVCHNSFQCKLSSTLLSSRDIEKDRTNRRKYENLSNGDMTNAAGWRRRYAMFTTFTGASIEKNMMRNQEGVRHTSFISRREFIAVQYFLAKFFEARYWKTSRKKYELIRNISGASMYYYGSFRILVCNSCCIKRFWFEKSILVFSFILISL